MPIKKDLIYPLFLECIEYTQDSFWRTVFDDLAYGKTPYGTYLNNDYLCCSYKNKDFSYKIDTTINPNTLYTDIYNLLNNRLGILSLKEKDNKRVEFNKFQSEIQDTNNEWNDIKKKNTKDLLINLYIIDMKNKHKLNKKQSLQLLSIIFISLLFKVITMKDIHYSNKKIYKIDNINFKKNDIILEKNLYNNKYNFTPEIIINQKSMSDNWFKMLVEKSKG